MAEIVLDKVTKKYGDGFEAVKEADFTIEDGEFFILVGPSGCGKSTLLNMIVGLEDISSGERRVDGKVVNDTDPKDRNMAMVFQSYAIYPHMTVRQNMAFPLRIAKMADDEVDRRRLWDSGRAARERPELVQVVAQVLHGLYVEREAVGDPGPELSH